MTIYDPNTWVDETGVGDGTIIDAAKMNHIETGIRDLGADIEAAKARVALLEGASRIIDVQVLPGANEGYKSITNTQSFFVDAAGGTPLRLYYQPEVDCWWEPRANIGLLQKTDPAYHYAYAYMQLNQADELGNSVSYQIFTQHSTVDNYGFRIPGRIFKLKAGVSYNVGVWLSSSGGTWQYYQGSQYLFIESKAWTR